jgi:hypothetical protein
MLAPAAERARSAQIGSVRARLVRMYAKGTSP